MRGYFMNEKTATRRLVKLITDNATRRAIEGSHGPYSWERIEPSVEKQGFHFRIADCNDNIVAFRLSQEEAEKATVLLNSGIKVPFDL